jgi:hypothetical protein
MPQFLDFFFSARWLALASAIAAEQRCLLARQFLKVLPVSNLEVPTQRMAKRAAMTSSGSWADEQCQRRRELRGRSIDAYKNAGAVRSRCVSH